MNHRVLEAQTVSLILKIDGSAANTVEFQTCTPKTYVMRYTRECLFLKEKKIKNQNQNQSQYIQSRYRAF